MMEFKKVNKILVFRSCCLGDVAMLTPVICNLHEQFPDAEIKISSSKWILNLLPYLPFIDDAILFDAPFETNAFRRILKTIKFILRLRKEKFDLVFLSNRHTAYGLILKLAGIRYRLGFDETKYLTDTVPYDHSDHFVVRHNKVLKAAGIKADINNLKLIAKRSKEEILKEYNLIDCRFVIGIFPFGGTNPGTIMNIKQWEFFKYIELIASLAESHRSITILFFEGYIEQEKITEEFNQANVKRLKINFDLISACDIFVSGDTGPLFVAEGLGVSTLSIFGPTDAEKIAPQSKNPGVIHKVIWHRPECSPCYTSITAFERDNEKYWDGNKFICNTGTHDCIKSTSVEEIKKELESMINILFKAG